MGHKLWVCVCCSPIAGFLPRWLPARFGEAGGELQDVKENPPLITRVMKAS